MSGTTCVKTPAIIILLEAEKRDPKGAGRERQENPSDQVLPSLLLARGELDTPECVPGSDAAPKPSVLKQSHSWLWSEAHRIKPFSQDEIKLSKPIIPLKATSEEQVSC